MSKNEELENKLQNMFEKNSILINENEQLRKENERFRKAIDLLNSYQMNISDTKILMVARKYKSNNIFIKYLESNIIEKWCVYSEDFKKLYQVKKNLESNGYKVNLYKIQKSINVTESGEIIDD